MKCCPRRWCCNWGMNMSFSLLCTYNHANHVSHPNWVDTILVLQQGRHYIFFPLLPWHYPGFYWFAAIRVAVPVLKTNTSNIRGMLHLELIPKLLDIHRLFQDAVQVRLFQFLFRSQWVLVPPFFFLSVLLPLLPFLVFTWWNWTQHQYPSLQLLVLITNSAVENNFLLTIRRSLWSRLWFSAASAAWESALCVAEQFGISF